jgi:hypothetical protein
MTSETIICCFRIGSYWRSHSCMIWLIEYAEFITGRRQLPSHSLRILQGSQTKTARFNIQIRWLWFILMCFGLWWQQGTNLQRKSHHYFLSDSMYCKISEPQNDGIYQKLGKQSNMKCLMCTRNRNIYCTGDRG